VIGCSADTLDLVHLATCISVSTEGALG